MATENFLWGAPRIHGELLKLGFTVSERTVSRYLPDRLTRRSQTWRTFFANHIGQLALGSMVTSSFATSEDDVDASDWPCRPAMPTRHARYASTRWALVDSPPSLQSTSLGWCVAQNQLHRRTPKRFRSGKDPPKWAVEPTLVAYGCGLVMSGDSISPEGPNERYATQPWVACAQSGGPHPWRAETPHSLQALKGRLPAATLRILARHTHTDISTAPADRDEAGISGPCSSPLFHLHHETALAC